MEDYSAHSNYTELALIELGERQIFPHVGRRTQVNLPGARHPVYPLITGTFGGVDFLHSVMVKRSTSSLAFLAKISFRANSTIRQPSLKFKSLRAPFSSLVEKGTLAFFRICSTKFQVDSLGTMTQPARQTNYNRMPRLRNCKILISLLGNLKHSLNS